MKTVFCLVVVLSLVSISLAAVRAGWYHDEDNPDQCTINEKLILNPGRHKDPRIKCGLIYCYNDGTAEMYTCSAMDINKPGYKYGDFVDPSRNYPKCCERKIVKA